MSNEHTTQALLVGLLMSFGMNYLAVSHMADSQEKNSNIIEYLVDEAVRRNSVYNKNLQILNHKVSHQVVLTRENIKKVLGD